MDPTASRFPGLRNRTARLRRGFLADAVEAFIRTRANRGAPPQRLTDWNVYLARGPIAPADFMAGVEDPPAREAR